MDILHVITGLAGLSSIAATIADHIERAKCERTGQVTAAQTDHALRYQERRLAVLEHRAGRTAADVAFLADAAGRGDIEGVRQMLSPVDPPKPEKASIPRDGMTFNE